MFAQSVHSACSPSRCIVVQAIDHGAIAIHQNRPAVSALLVCLHADAEQEHHAPVPAVIKGDKVHPYLVVAAPELLAVDKLLTEKVLVSNIKPAEDLNLSPVAASSTALWAAS